MDARGVCTTRAVAKKKLAQLCEEQRLYAGMFAVHHFRSPTSDVAAYAAYFRHYGLSADVFRLVCAHDPAFNFAVRQQGWSVERAMQEYGMLYDLPVVPWVPKYVHVYELIQQRFPHFGWEAVHRTYVVKDEQRCRCYVVFRNYPTLNDYPTVGSVYQPTLYDLLTCRDLPIPADYSAFPRESRHKRRGGRSAARWYKAESLT